MDSLTGICIPDVCLLPAWGMPFGRRMGMRHPVYNNLRVSDNPSTYRMSGIFILVANVGVTIGPEGSIFCLLEKASLISIRQDI